MKLYLQLFSFFLLSLLITAGGALSQKIIFNKILPSEGKTFEHVTGIVQDQQGYMWFASKKGLYRYDGYHMTSYKNNALNSNSLVSNTLESICSDSAGNIWIGSLGAGLDRLDPNTGTFLHFHHNSKDPSGLSNDTVATLLCDHEGILWVGTHRGLDRFDPNTNKFIHYRHDPNDPATISNNLVRSLYEDRQRTLWVGTGSPFPDNGGTPEDGGLNRFNKKNGKFIRYLHNPGNSNSLINNKVRAIFEDAEGTFWVGTGGNGLHTMDRVAGTFKRHLYDSSHPGELTLSSSKKISIFSHITFITQDAAGAMWVGTLDAGLYYYDPKTQKIRHYESNTDSIGEFRGNSAWSAYTSRDGVLWISNLQGDLYRVDPFQKRLPHFELTAGPATSFYQEPGGILWIGSENGLIRNDTNTKTTRRFVNDPLNPATISNNSVMSLLADRQGRIWVGTQEGLNLFDPGKEAFTRYLHDPKNNNSLRDNFILPLYEDQQQNFWTGTFKGLDLMNRKTGSFTHYIINQTDTSRFGSNLVTALLEDRQGKFWVGLWGQTGVNQLDRETGKFEKYLKEVDVTSIYEDADGILWAGGEDGLYQFNRSTQTFSRFADPSSLAGIQDVVSMEEDDKKNLWLGTTSGIIKLNPQRNETTIYDENYGVKENTLLPTASYKGRHGELFFGDTTGYFSFFPDEVTKNPGSPEILLTAFRIANKAIPAGGNNGLFPGLLWKTKQINLNYDQNVFSFDFVSIDYSNPGANRNLFMLENYDNEWHIADKSGRAYYFNVPPGKYIFKIKSSNVYGVWARKDILVLITPPWWRTWWAYMLFAVVFIGVIWGIIYYRSRSLIREKRYLEEKVKNRTTEVVKQKEEISIQRDNLKQALDELKAAQNQLIQSEKMASLGELTAGIAHEIQNPLNFVNNFSDVNTELIEEMKKELANGNEKEAMTIADNIKENEQKIVYHGKRADEIVKGMLQHSRNSTGKKEPTDINDLADEYLRLSYHGLRARDKGFNATIQTDFDKNIGEIHVIPQEIGRVLLNLLTNAFYAVTEKKKQQGETRLQDGQGYEPTVLVSTKKVNDRSAGYRIEVRVRDNGNGIPQKALAKIFQPFFTTKPTGQGTGLGLSISYDIIKSHGGEMKVETKEGEFTEFMVILPYH